MSKRIEPTSLLYFKFGSLKYYYWRDCSRDYSTAYCHTATIYLALSEYQHQFSTLFLLTRYCSVDTVKNSYTCQPEETPITRVKLTPLIMINRSQYETVRTRVPPQESPTPTNIPKPPPRSTHPQKPVTSNMLQNL